MKKVTVILIGLFLMTFAFTSVNAQSIASGDASALILEPIELTKGAELMFGSIAAGTVSSDIKIDADLNGARSVLAGGDATLYTSGPGQNGTFTVSGEFGATFAITLPANGSVTLGRTGGGASMNVNAFDSDQVNEVGTLDGSGDATFKVGATLTVGIDQMAGEYTGTYPVTVNYN